MKAMALVKSFMTKDVDPDTIAAQIADTKAVVANHRAEAERLAAQWRDAESMEAAELIERRKVEALRLAERGELALPEMERKLVTTRAERQRAGIARHQKIMRDLYPRLRRAIEDACIVQHEAIAAREAAERELSGGVVAIHVPHLSYRGFLMSDLVKLWSDEMDRTFAARPVAPVAVVAPPVAVAPVKPAAAKPAQPVAPVAPVKPRRPLHKSKVAVGDRRLIVFLRPNVELPGGELSLVGDQLDVDAKQAEQLVRSGACEYVSADAGANVLKGN
jgi:hypothetical protein